MKLFKYLKSIFSSTPSQSTKKHELPKETLKSPKKTTFTKVNSLYYTKKLQDLYSSYNYENIPEIENEASAKWVLNNINGMFGAILVPKEYMKNISKVGHSFTTGEIVLLWWLTSRKNISNKPLYFYRTYGIDPNKSTEKLIINGLLTKDMKLTPTGKRVLNNSKMIIKHHRAVKAWSGTGPVKYFYPKKTETKIPKKYAGISKKQQYPWSAFDISLQDAKSEHCKYIHWLTSTHPCKQCKKIGSADNGKGSGIYSIKDAPTLRDQIHPGCTCRIFPYKLIERNLPPTLTFSTRDPKTGKSIIIKAKQY